MEISSLMFNTFLIFLAAITLLALAFYFLRKILTKSEQSNYISEPSPSHIVKPKVYNVTNLGIQKTSMKFSRYTIPDQQIEQNLRTIPIRVKFQNRITVINKK